MLDQGRFAKEEYFAHLELRVDDLVALVTASRVIMAKVRNNRSEWDIPYSGVFLFQSLFFI